MPLTFNIGYVMPVHYLGIVNVGEKILLQCHSIVGIDSRTKAICEMTEFLYMGLGNEGFSFEMQAMPLILTSELSLLVKALQPILIMQLITYN